MLGVSLKTNKALTKTLNAMQNYQGKSITAKVGVFKGSKYPDGTSVVDVAIWNEFGHGVPERPAWRNSVPKIIDKVNQLIKEQHLVNDDAELSLNVSFMKKAGALAQGEIQQSIVDLREPPNAPSTIAKKRKRHSDLTKDPNPLIDTGTLRRSITYRIKVT